MATVTAEQLQALQVNIDEQFAQVGTQMATLRNDMGVSVGRIEQEKQQFGEAVATNLVNAREMMDALKTDLIRTIEGAREEFTGVKAINAETRGALEAVANNLLATTNNIDAAVVSVTQRVLQIEQKIEEQERQLQDVHRHGGGGDDHRGGKTSYLPWKSTVPKVMTDKINEWINWRDDFLEHVDTVTNGMKLVLEEFGKAEADPTEIIIQGYTNLVPTLPEEKVKIYRALKKLTAAKPARSSPG